jgi:hypothetical protein
MHTIQAKLGAQLAKACCRYITYQETKQHLETPRHLDTSHLTPHTWASEVNPGKNYSQTKKAQSVELTLWSHILSVWTSNAHPIGMNIQRTSYRYEHIARVWLTHDNNIPVHSDSWQQQRKSKWQADAYKQMHASTSCAVCSVQAM